jgi:hypothetical protein
MKCEYCGKDFKRESSLAAHMCRDKKRWLQKDEQHVRLGLSFFNDWYRIAMGSNTRKDYKAFMKSQYYGAFVRFGLYVLETRVLAPERYLEWLIKSKIAVDRWCKDSVYNQYLAEQSKRETAERALERFVMHTEKWSERTGFHWSEYWDNVKPFTLVNDIKMGKVSPWVFLGYSKAKAKLDELPIELLTDIAETIDLPFWQRKIDVNKPTVEWIEEILGASK